MPDPASPIAASPYRCPACAGQGIWHAGRQIVACRSCGAAIDTPPAPPGPIEAFEFLPLLRDRPDSGRDWQPGATRVRCTTCGTSMEYPAYLAGRNCEGCGSPALVPCDATGAPIHPTGVIPFQLGEAQARDRVDAWLENERPHGSSRHVAVEAMRAVYVPGWTFAAHVRVPWRALWQRRNREGETVHTPIDGVVELDLDDWFIGASAALPGGLLRELEAFDATALQPYDPRYLAGCEVELYGVNLWDAWDAAEAQMLGEVDRSVRSDAGRGAMELETWPEWSGQRCRHVLVPVYVADCTNAGRRSTVFVDGRAGRVKGANELDLTPAGRAPVPDAGAVIEGPQTLRGRLGCLFATFVLLAVLAGLAVAAVAWIS